MSSHFARANNLFRSNKFNEAIDLYTKAIEENSNQVKYYSNRCAAYLCAGNGKKALSDAETCVKKKPKWSKSWSRKGAALFLMGNYIDAIVAYKQGLALEPDSVTLKLGLSESREAQRERPDFSALERAESEAAPEEENKSEDIMEAFMSEISSLDGGTTRVQKPKAPKRKVDDSEIDALTGPQHIDRLVRGHFLLNTHSINFTQTHTHWNTGTKKLQMEKFESLLRSSSSHRRDGGRYKAEIS